MDLGLNMDYYREYRSRIYILQKWFFTIDYNRGVGFRVYGPGTFYGLLEEQDLELMDLRLKMTTVDNQDLSVD